MKPVLVIGLLLYTGTVAAQAPVRLSAKVVEVMKTELNYVYDSTSNRRTGSYKVDTTRLGIHDRFPTIHNPSPLVIVDGVPTSVEKLDSLNATVVDTIEIWTSKSRKTTAVYGARATQGVIMITTKK